eukprot:scaffold42167_cov30-Tisochrysis_lutea.AAC.7
MSTSLLRYKPSSSMFGVVTQGIRHAAFGFSRGSSSGALLRLSKVKKLNSRHAPGLAYSPRSHARLPFILPSPAALRLVPYLGGTGKGMSRGPRAMASVIPGVIVP